MEKWIGISQILISIIVIALILIQERGGDAGGIVGGEHFGGFHQVRRGLEKITFVATIIMVIMFGLLALTSFLI